MDRAEEVARAEDARTNRWASDSAELARWKGQALTARAGCRLAWLPLGAASVLTEYELQDDQALILTVLVNGVVIDAESYLHPRVLEGLESLLWEDHKRDSKLPVSVADMRRAA